VLVTSYRQTFLHQPRKNPSSFRRDRFHSPTSLFCCVTCDSIAKNRGICKHFFPVFCGTGQAHGGRGRALWSVLAKYMPLRCLRDASGCQSWRVQLYRTGLARVAAGAVSRMRGTTSGKGVGGGQSGLVIAIGFTKRFGRVFGASPQAGSPRTGTRRGCTR